MLPYSTLLLIIPLKAVALFIAARGTVTGSLRPDRVTLALVSLPSFISFCIAVTHGAAFSALPVLLAGLAPLLVLILSFFSHHKPWGIHSVDYFSGGLSLVAIIVWIFIKNPSAAVLVSVAADLLAFVPTFAKAWRFPSTESSWIYVLGALCNIIGLLTLTTWSIETAGFSVYLTLMGAAMIVVILHKKLARRFQRAI